MTIGKVLSVCGGDQRKTTIQVTQEGEIITNVKWFYIEQREKLPQRIARGKCFRPFGKYLIATKMISLPLFFYPDR